MAFKPHGIVVPIVTPVTQDGKFNEKAYRDLIEYLASSGIHGVFPFGTTGEFYAHDMGFYREVLAVTKDAVRGRMDIYAGANNITTRGAVEIAKALGLPVLGMTAGVGKAQTGGLETGDKDGQGRPLAGERLAGGAGGAF